MNRRSRDHLVLIVGAGPTGLTAAVELSRLGVNVRIVDRAPEPSTTSRALAIQARTLELLQQRGVGEEMRQRGNTATSAAIYGRGKKLGTVEFDRIPSRFDSVLLLAQPETEQVLSDTLARQGVQVERGIELITFTSDQSGDGHIRAVVEAADGSREVIDATHLIGADGAHSTTRHVLKLPFAGRALDQEFVLADLHLDADLAEDQLSIFLAPDGFLAVFPMTDHRFRFIATDPRAAVDEADPPTLDRLQRIYDHISRIPAHLRDMNWSSRFTINSRHLSTLRVGNVFFGGDCAHVHSPAGGQGMNTGIQDMINLSWKLAMVLRGQAKPALLDTYETDRLPVIHRLVHTTDSATRAIDSRSPLVYGLITRLAPLALGTPAVQNAAARALGQVGASYRTSAVTVGGGRLGKLFAGDRIPDIEVSLPEPDKSTMRLYELLDLSGPTLFVHDSEADPGVLSRRLFLWRQILTVRRIVIGTRQPALRGEDAQIAADLAARPCLLLLRPDAYVAAIARDLEPILDWISAWFIPAQDTGYKATT